MKWQKNRFSRIHFIRPVRYKFWIFMFLITAMILSGIQLKPNSVLLTASPTDISHHTAKLRQTVVMPYHDILMSGISGRRDAESLIACSIRNRGQTIYQMTDSGLPTDVSTYAFLFLCTGSALRRRNRQPYIRSWIIRYIHDQDGEKEGALSS